jgi:aspartate kinase
MTLIVQKYGGTSVGNLERIRAVADRVLKAKAQGHDVVVVVSAMSGETDRLIQLAYGIDEQPHSREYDALLATGEQASTALLCIALIAKGCPARSYTGYQAGIITNSSHKKARILELNATAIRRDLAEGKVPVIAGFQGMDKEGNITTLGRGGSDTTAVALAATLKANECQIYTDVEGVYTTDPKIVPQARRLERITFEEMLELSSLGAKVLQIRSVEFAGKYNVPVRVLSSFVDGPGTLIALEECRMENALISGVAFDRNQAKLTILGIPDRPGTASHILNTISEHDIDIDMIVQNIPSPDRSVDFSFTVRREDYKDALTLLNQASEQLNARGVLGDEKIAKLSIVGVGMRSHAGVATKMFTALGMEGINIQLISTSEIKISVIIDEKYLELGARTLHAAFDLDRETKDETRYK